MEREKFKSRLGFILISAGCAIGIGNVWRFPYVVGNNGGGCFVLFYILFLVILGLPILTMEFSVGRASQQSISRSFKALEKKGQHWHLHGYVGMAGNYILNDVLHYCCRMDVTILFRHGQKVIHKRYYSRCAGSFF